MKRKAARIAKTRLFFALLLLGPMALCAAAQEGCSGFSWPVETEMAWMTSPLSEPAETGAQMPSLTAKAIALKLKPSQLITLPVKSGKKQPVAPDSYSGWFEIKSLPKSGLYQIALSHEGWIDVIQNGEPVQSQAFTGQKECKIVRKSVRFELGAGPVTVEISGAPADTVKVTIREAN